VSESESKLTLKVGVIASFVAALVIFILSTLQGHQNDIATLKANQAHVMVTLTKMETIPAELAKMTEQIRMMTQVQIVHKGISETNLRILKANGNK
jgi:energy-converting hydrogenase Eha subunit B